MRGLGCRWLGCRGGKGRLIGCRGLGCRGGGGRGLLWRPFSFFCGWVSRAGPAPTDEDSRGCVGAGHARDGVASKLPVARWDAGPAGRRVRGRTGFRGRTQPFGAEPGGGVRNREKGASCLSAASSCPAGSAARRPGSSQRQGCPFFWFFSLGRQRKERHPGRGAMAFWWGWRVREDQAERL